MIEICRFGQNHLKILVVRASSWKNQVGKVPKTLLKKTRIFKSKIGFGHFRKFFSRELDPAEKSYRMVFWGVGACPNAPRSAKLVQKCSKILYCTVLKVKPILRSQSTPVSKIPKALRLLFLQKNPPGKMIPGWGLKT